MRVGIKRIDEGMYRRGFEGLSYETGKDIKDIAKEVRVALKERYPRSKWSVRVEKYAGGRSLHINLMESPFHEDSQAVKDMLTYARDVSDSFNYNFSDGMIDYFSVNFYEHIGVGIWDKQYKVVK